MDYLARKLPLDVIGHIADVLGADRRQILSPECWYYTGTLHQLSLTSKFMVPICQRHLFSNIRFPSLRGDLRWRNGRSKFLLSQSIITMHYLKNLDFDSSHPFSKLEYDLLKSICNSSALTSVKISNGGWNKLPRRKKSVIWSLIQIPTLRHLTLERINNFPATAFSLCCGPTALTLHDIVKVASPSTNDAIQTSKITALAASNCSVNGTLDVLLGPTSQNKAGEVHPIIAYDCLKDASFTIGTRTEVSQVCKLLKKVTGLESLRIHVVRRKAWPVWVGSSLTANPLPKLKNVVLDLDGDFEEDDGDVILNGLNHELRELSTKNVFETLEVRIKVNLDTRNGPLRDWSAWADEFDRVLTHIGAFPVLRKVTFELTWFVLDISSSCAYLDSSPGGLTEGHFPRLLRSKNLGFWFSEDCDSYSDTTTLDT